MTIGIARRRARPRWAIAAATVAVGTLLIAAVAQANLTGSSFEGSDGNLVVTSAGNTDWANVAGRSTGVDQPTGSADNAFGQGTKEDNAAVTVVDGSIPPNKNDLTRFYEASEQGSNGHIYLYLGWERLVNIGNANLDFEINKNTTSGFTGSTTGAVNLNRTAGDLLVTYDFGGSGAPTLGLNYWLTAAAGNTASQCFSANALPCWGKHQTLTTNSEGAVNTATIAEPIAGGTLTAGLFGEAAIDLTAAGVFPSGVCEAFGSTFVKSRSSSSFTAEIKDFIAPVPVNISNCGTIIVHKTTENGDSSFGYTTTGTGLSSFSLSNGGTKTFTPLQAGSYKVTENLTAAQTTAGWTLKTLSCTSTNGNSTFSYAKPEADITLSLGDTVDCYYTNHINVTPGISTTPSAGGVVGATTVKDTATLSGGVSPTGSITFKLYGPSATASCTGAALDTETVTVSGNGDYTTPTGYVPTATGTYWWTASYSGDTSNNNSAPSACGDEKVVITKASPGISTTPSAGGVVGSTTVTDTAALTGGYNPTGSIEFKLYGPSATASCAGTVLDDETVTVNGAGNYSTPTGFAPTAAGTYWWMASYSGDGNNNAKSSTCGDEKVVITKASPGISTTPSAGGVVGSTTVTDTAALTGGYNPTGSIEFKLYGPSATASCAGTVLDDETVTVNGAGNYSTPTGFAPTAAGTYWWMASYSGDGNNNAKSSACGDESVVITKASPSASTAQKLLPNDSFTLSGGVSPTGTVTLSLFGPGDATCSSTPAYTQTVNVSGNGTYWTTNSSFYATDEGTWRWMSSYSGDGNNQSASSACGLENFTITNH